MDMFSLTGPAASEAAFIYGISVFATRPHLLNKKIKGADIYYSEGSDDPHASPKFYSATNTNEVTVPDDLVLALKEPFLEGTINELKNFNVERFQLTRRLLTPRLKEYYSHETWDLNRKVVIIESHHEYNKDLPPVRFTFTFFATSVDDNAVKIEVQSLVSQPAAGVSLSMKFYEEKVIPRILKWVSCEDSFGQANQASIANQLIPSTSLKFVSSKEYYELYKHLKNSYFSSLQQVWTETTDPEKFVCEEFGIASYVKSLISSESRDDCFTFVDFGCGNGVLTFALRAMGIRGYGFDIRARKIWTVFPQLGIVPDLRVWSFNPFSDVILPSPNLWLLGNHCDELTPWVPVIARRCQAEGFLVIPCCLYDFHGKFQRKAKKAKENVDPESMYQNYVHYIAEVGKKCGFNIRIDKLRIPSTKRVCIIGTNFPKDNPEYSKTMMEGLEYADSKVYGYPSTDPSIGYIKTFTPRNPIERVNNMSQLDRIVLDNIVARIFQVLIADAPTSEKLDDWGYTKPWRTGRTDLTLAETAKLLTSEERHFIQKQGRGVQTLLKNNHQIFRIREGYVTLRRPIVDDMCDKAMSKLKSRTCYYFENHPDGCPLSDERCRFKHAT